MKLIGLTGSIGAGKSAAVAWLLAQGVPVHDADAAVHEIYASPETLNWINENFPTTITDGLLDKNQLARLIFSDPQARKKLENYMHPRVAAHRADFGAKAPMKSSARMIVFDIPLLFETGAQTEFDEVWLITAPDEVRMTRALTRPGMTAEKFTAINATQMPQAEKAKLATHVIENNGALEQLHEQLACLIGQK